METLRAPENSVSSNQRVARCKVGMLIQMGAGIEHSASSCGKGTQWADLLFLAVEERLLSRTILVGCVKIVYFQAGVSQRCRSLQVWTNYCSELETDEVLLTSELNSGYQPMLVTERFDARFVQSQTVLPFPVASTTEKLCVHFSGSPAVRLFSVESGTWGGDSGNSSKKLQ